MKQYKVIRVHPNHCQIDGQKSFQNLYEGDRLQDALNDGWEILRVDTVVGDWTSNDYILIKQL